jgi:hypothetical protein
MSNVIINRVLQVSLIVILAIICNDLKGQQVVVKAELDTNRALIGDQLKLQLSVDKPENLRVDFPAIKDTLTKSIEILNAGKIDTSQFADGRLKLRQNLLIAAYDTGFLMIPPQGFIIHLNGSTDTLNTLPVYFEIASVPLDSTIRDIKANYKAPVSFLEIYPYLLAAGVGGLFVWLLVYYVQKRRRKEQQITDKVTTEPPDVIALRELEKLKTEKAWLQRSVKPYYIKLTEILRVYLERRYNIMALEQTTGEILYSLKKKECASADLNMLAGILNLADLVKFAKVIPDQAENASQVDLAIDFVRNTVYREPVLEKAAVVEDQLVPSKTES